MDEELFYNILLCCTAVLQYSTTYRLGRFAATLSASILILKQITKQMNGVCVDWDKDRGCGD